jgi:truncated hemoglobin YjbI
MAAGRGLVERFGGVDGLRRILRRFYARLAADPMVGFFFAGRDLGGIVEGQLGFLLYAFGEVPQLRVRHPRDAHGGLPPILRGHFDRRLVVLEETLREAGLSDEDVRAWLKIETALRRQVQARGDSKPRS